MDVLDDIVATGADGLNPIETVAGMSLKEVRQRYPRLFLAGGIDMSQLLSNGTPEEVKEVCRQAIQNASPGYFMGSTRVTTAARPGICRHVRWRWKDLVKRELLIKGIQEGGTQERIKWTK
jgi:hypothetical protein